MKKSPMIPAQPRCAPPCGALFERRLARSASPCYGQPHCSGQPACSRLLPHACMHQPRCLFAARDATSPAGLVRRAPHCSAAARSGSASTGDFCCAHAALQRVTKRWRAQLESARARLTNPLRAALGRRAAHGWGLAGSRGAAATAARHAAQIGPAANVLAFCSAACAVCPSAAAYSRARAPGRAGGDADGQSARAHRRASHTQRGCGPTATGSIRCTRPQHNAIDRSLDRPPSFTPRNCSEAGLRARTGVVDAPRRGRPLRPQLRHDRGAVRARRQLAQIGRAAARGQLLTPCRGAACARLVRALLLACARGTTSHTGRTVGNLCRNVTA